MSHAKKNPGIPHFRVGDNAPEYQSFQTLFDDRSFSPKIRDKFRAALEKRIFEDYGG